MQNETSFEVEKRGHTNRTRQHSPRRPITPLDFCPRSVSEQPPAGPVFALFFLFSISPLEKFPCASSVMDIAMHWFFCALGQNSRPGCISCRGAAGGMAPARECDHNREGGSRQPQSSGRDCRGFFWVFFFFSNNHKFNLIEEFQRVCQGLVGNLPVV